MIAKYSTIILATTLTIVTAFADTVTTKDGSAINGKIILIDKDVVHLDTPFAKKIQIKQKEVEAIETDEPIVLRFKNGMTIPGIVSATEKGLSIQAGENIIDTKFKEVVASWLTNKIDPEVARNQRKWRNDLSIDLNGRTGNVDRFNFGMEFDFRIKGPIDELYFGFEYEQGEQSSVKTDDRAIGQMAYEQFLKNKLGWFIGSSLETDPLNDVYVRSSTQTGSSYRFINNDVQTLVSRTGLGYRFTEFVTTGSENESTGTLVTSLIHTLKLNESLYLQNKVDYSPSLKDPKSNFNLGHDSSLRISMDKKSNFWIRIGMRNEYESLTSASEKLDTNYYSKLVYSFK